jgi:hypothetical protein
MSSIYLMVSAGLIFFGNPRIRGERRFNHT